MESSAPSAPSTPKSSFILQDLTLAMPENELTLICGRLGESVGLRRAEERGSVDARLTFLPLPSSFPSNRCWKVSAPPRPSRRSRRLGWSTRLPSVSSRRDATVQGGRRRDRRRRLDRQAGDGLRSSGESDFLSSRWTGISRREELEVLP